MEQKERDEALLSLLDPDAQAMIEAIVDAIVDGELLVRDGPNILAAASSFDARAETLPDDERLVAWQIAAALRGRTGSSPSSLH